MAMPKSIKYNLLSSNAKLAKAASVFGDSVIVAGLALAPHMRSGYNVCPNAGFCSVVCNLWFSGMTVMGNVRQGMERKAKMLFEQRDEFHEQLHADLAKLARYAERENAYAFCRLNVASDLDWLGVIEAHPWVNFYDYSKVTSRCDAMAAGDLPENYHVTASWNERMKARDLKRWLRRGMNAAVVWDTPYSGQHKHLTLPLPTMWKKFPGVDCFDADTHDLRHPDYDGEGRLGFLHFKGTRKLMAEAIKRGFVMKDPRLSLAS